MHSRYDLQDEEIEKIVAFVEREAGRDAPLSKTDVEATSKLIEKEAAASEFAVSIREINDQLDRLFNDLTQIEIPEYIVKILKFLKTVRMDRDNGQVKEAS